MSYAESQDLTFYPVDKVVADLLDVPFMGRDEKEELLTQIPRELEPDQLRTIANLAFNFRSLEFGEKILSIGMDQERRAIYSLGRLSLEFGDTVTAKNATDFLRTRGGSANSLKAFLLRRTIVEEGVTEVYWPPGAQNPEHLGRVKVTNQPGGCVVESVLLPQNKVLESKKISHHRPGFQRYAQKVIQKARKEVVYGAAAARHLPSAADTVTL